MPIIYDCTVSSPGSMSSTTTTESVSRASDCSSHMTSLSRTQYAKPTIVKTDIIRQPSQVDGAAQISPLEKTLPKVWPVQLRKACQFCRKRKIKCEADQEYGPCKDCRIREQDCIYAPIGTADSATPIDIKPIPMGLPAKSRQPLVTPAARTHKRPRSPSTDDIDGASSGTSALIDLTRSPSPQKSSSAKKFAYAASASQMKYQTGATSRNRPPDTDTPRQPYAYYAQVAPGQFVPMLPAMPQSTYVQQPASTILDVSHIAYSSPVAGQSGRVWISPPQQSYQAQAAAIDDVWPQVTPTSHTSFAMPALDQHNMTHLLRHQLAQQQPQRGIMRTEPVTPQQLRTMAGHPMPASATTPDLRSSSVSPPQQFHGIPQHLLNASDSPSIHSRSVTSGSQPLSETMHHTSSTSCGTASPVPSMRVSPAATLGFSHQSPLMPAQMLMPNQHLRSFTEQPPAFEIDFDVTEPRREIYSLPPSAFITPPHLHLTAQNTQLDDLSNAGLFDLGLPSIGAHLDPHVHLTSMFDAEAATDVLDQSMPPMHSYESQTFAAPSSLDFTHSAAMPFGYRSKGLPTFSSVQGHRKGAASMPSGRLTTLMH